jgi:hypothetical protein
LLPLLQGGQDGWKGTAPVTLEEKKANVDVVSGTMMVAGRGC